jgi:hypothetical protein
MCVFESNYFCGRTIHGTVCLHWKQCGQYVMYVRLVYKTCTWIFQDSQWSTHSTVQDLGFLGTRVLVKCWSDQRVVHFLLIRRLNDEVTALGVVPTPKPLWYHTRHQWITGTIDMVLVHFPPHNCIAMKKHSPTVCSLLQATKQQSHGDHSCHRSCWLTDNSSRI